MYQLFFIKSGHLKRQRLFKKLKKPNEKSLNYCTIRIRVNMMRISNIASEQNYYFFKYLVI